MRSQSLWTMFFMPLMIAALSMFGLIAALIGDGIWDTAGWLALVAPVVMTLWAYFRRRQL